MKKIMCILLSVCMLFGISVFPAFAQDSNLPVGTNLAEYAIVNEMNIVLYDSNNFILAEYHTDGYTANFEWIEGYTDSAERVLSRITDNQGASYVFNGDQVETYYKEELIETRSYNDTEEDEQDDSLIVPRAYSTFYVYHQDGTSETMNTLVSDSNFVRSSSSPSQSQIQTLLSNNKSPLANNIVEYKLDSKGNLIKGSTITPAKVIYDASVSEKISPKMILMTLQKESSLVSSSQASTPVDRKIYYMCMGIGGTTYSGFSKQVSRGANRLRYWYDYLIDKKTSFPYYYSAPPSNPSQSEATQDCFHGYHGYGKTNVDHAIWCDNAATFSLYKYTPYTSQDASTNDTFSYLGNVFIKRQQNASWIKGITW